MSQSHTRWEGILSALLAACLFGASTPLAKLLLPKMDPVLMAGLLYLASGIGLGAYRLFRSHNRALRSKEAPLTRADWPWLAAAVLALRHIGTSRTSAYFSTAPFVGAAISILLLGDPITGGLGFAAALMGTGVWLHLTERHTHEHQHEPLEHAHLHTHDDHHRHAHEPSDPAVESHSHAHSHAGLIHAHPHYPDIHHRHGH